MWIPEKAIIRTPTHDDAIRLLSFLAKYGYHWMGGEPLLERDKWVDYQENMAYDLEPNHNVLYCGVDWYRDQIEKYNAGEDIEDVDEWMPEDPALQLCSVDEFLAYCMGFDASDDIEVADPMSIL